MSLLNEYDFIKLNYWIPWTLSDLLVSHHIHPIRIRGGRIGQSSFVMSIETVHIKMFDVSSVGDQKHPTPHFFEGVVMAKFNRLNIYVKQRIYSTFLVYKWIHLRGVLLWPSVLTGTVPLWGQVYVLWLRDCTCGAHSKSTHHLWMWSEGLYVASSMWAELHLSMSLYRRTSWLSRCSLNVFEESSTHLPCETQMVLGIQISP